MYSQISRFAQLLVAAALLCSEAQAAAFATTAAGCIAAGYDKAVAVRERVVGDDGVARMVITKYQCFCASPAKQQAVDLKLVKLIGAGNAPKGVTIVEADKRQQTKPTPVN